MKIEILYPELAGLFGDSGNVKYLARALPQAEFVQTPLGARPLFASETPALLYLGPLSERGQARVLRELLPYRERLGELIEGGARMLCTGNAFELFGHYIDCRGEEPARLECLDLLDYYAVRDLNRRCNGGFLGRWGETEVVGFVSRFSHVWTGEGTPGAFSVLRGPGQHEGAAWEGVHVRHFLGTSLLGPLLPLNPDLAEALLAPLGAVPVFPETARAALAQRLREFHDEKRSLD